MYFIPICDTEAEPPLSKKAICQSQNFEELLTTAQFIKHKEETKGEHTDYVSEQMQEQVKHVLQVQIFMVYQWSVLRARIEHPHSLKRLHFACNNVTPLHFVVEDSDVQLYLSNPCFLWRFSMNNYGYFYTLFIKGLTKKHKLALDTVYSDQLLTYNKDFTECVPYYFCTGGVIENYLRYFFGKTTKQSSKWYRMYDFEKLLENSSAYTLSETNVKEFHYSLDYRVQLLDSSYSYEDCVRILVTGHTERDAGPLLRSIILQEKYHRKENRKKLANNF